MATFCFSPASTLSMATETDLVLDLSAKSTLSAGVPSLLSRTLSPTTSLNSDPDRCSSSAFSDPGDRDRDLDRSFGIDNGGGVSPLKRDLGGESLVKPVKGPVPSLPTGISDKELQLDSSGLGNPCMPPGMRPFKMYPFEPMAGMSQLASPGTMSGGNLFSSPLGATASPGLPLGLMDVGGSLGSLSSTPIAQYLQQRKRRLDSRNSTHSNSSNNSSSSTVTAAATVLAGTAMPSSVSPTNTGPERNTGKKPKMEQPSGAEEPGSCLEERRDDSYWDRRRKNNEAAKRSRDARRMKEEEIALRAAFLEQENLKLRAQVAILKNETAKLHYMLYNRL